jgi:hypothetical protein
MCTTSGEARRHANAKLAKCRHKCTLFAWSKRRAQANGAAYMTYVMLALKQKRARAALLVYCLCCVPFPFLFWFIGYWFWVWVLKIQIELELKSLKLEAKRPSWGPMGLFRAAAAGRRGRRPLTGAGAGPRGQGQGA